MSTQLANAQQNMLMVGNNGKINAISVSSVDYATFNANDKLFTISNDGIDAGATFIRVVCTVALSSESNVKTLSVNPEVGVCYSRYNSVPTIDDDDCWSLGSKLKSYTFTLESLTPGTTYYFRMYVKWAGGVFYGEAVKAKTLVDKSQTINGHKFIDLGLPSGLLWAETNIGAETATDDGYYFAWGKTSTEYDYFDYTYPTYTTDGKTTLKNAYDAACVNWGSCHMPTNENFAELLNSANCTWTWSDMGYFVTSVRNGNSIFLPAAGCRRGSFYYYGSRGYYWSKTLSNDTHAYCLCFSSSTHYQYGADRREGCTIRPVAKP